MKQDFLLLVGYFCTVVLLKGTFKKKLQVHKGVIMLKTN